MLLSRRDRRFINQACRKLKAYARRARSKPSAAGDTIERTTSDDCPYGIWAGESDIVRGHESGAFPRGEY